MDDELTTIMENAYDAVRDIAQEHGITLRTAAFMLAIQRVAAAVKVRGV